MLLNPRKKDTFRKIGDGNDSFGTHGAAVDRSHVLLSFSHNVGGRALAPGRDRAKLMADALAFDVAVDGSALPIPHIPAVPNADDESVLVSVAHYFLPLFPHVQDYVAYRQVSKVEKSAIGAFFLAIPSAVAIPTQSGHIYPIADRGCVPPLGCGHECGCEPTIPGLVSVLPTGRSRSAPGRCCRLFGIPLGHLLFLLPYFRLLKDVAVAHLFADLLALAPFSQLGSPTLLSQGLP